MTISLRKTLNKENILRVLLLASVLLFSFNSFSITDSQTVIVTSKNSDISSMEIKDIRRIFLGLRPINSSQGNTPIINTSNKKSYKLFLKNIMFLTERGYKRKLLKRVFRQGADEITSFDSIKDITTNLKTNPNNFTFMLKKDALTQPDLKVIQALW